MNSVLEYLLALPIDLLRVVGFERTARRVERWLLPHPRATVLGATAVQATEPIRFTHCWFNNYAAGVAVSDAEEFSFTVYGPT